MRKVEDFIPLQNYILLRGIKKKTFNIDLSATGNDQGGLEKLVIEKASEHCAFYYEKGDEPVVNLTKDNKVNGISLIFEDDKDLFLLVRETDVFGITKNSKKNSPKSEKD